MFVLFFPREISLLSHSSCHGMLREKTFSRRDNHVNLTPMMATVA